MAMVTHDPIVTLMAVTRCVCHQRCFRTIAEVARARGWTTVTEVTAATRAGSGCGACIPYIAAVLSSGHTCFAVAEPGQAPQPCRPDPRH